MRWTFAESAPGPGISTSAQAVPDVGRPFLAFRACPSFPPPVISFQSQRRRSDRMTQLVLFSATLPRFRLREGGLRKLRPVVSVLSIIENPPETAASLFGTSVRCSETRTKGRKKAPDGATTKLHTFKHLASFCSENETIRTEHAHCFYNLEHRNDGHRKSLMRIIP